jgi:hypothetical protein
MNFISVSVSLCVWFFGGNESVGELGDNINCRGQLSKKLTYVVSLSHSLTLSLPTESDHTSHLSLSITITLIFIYSFSLSLMCVVVVSHYLCQSLLSFVCLALAFDSVTSLRLLILIQLHF